MIKIFCLVFLLITSHLAVAQNEEALIQFNSAQVENHVQLNFTLAAGNTCNGIRILRSSDSVNFLEIGDIQGVCGSYDRNESYGFIDYSPVKNKVNYYRLQLGNLGDTYVISLFFIELKENTPLTFPNPVTDLSEIYFLNTAHEELVLSIFSYDRKLVYESKPDRVNSFQILRKNFTPGTYFFRIGNAEAYRYRGKFLVQ